MARKKIKTATNQRNFTMVYNDFLESSLLDKHEKLIFIAIKRFADNNTLKAFPSLKTLHRVTGISIRWIKKSIEHMEQLGVISVEKRADQTNNSNLSNIYKLYDYAEIWGIESNNDCIEEIADEIEEMKLVAELRARGYTVKKEKELVSEPTKAHQQALDNQSVKGNVTTKSNESQEERYTIEQIRLMFEYEFMLSEKPLWKDNIDSILNILHTVINSKKKSIRVGGEEKPTMVVIGKLMKLTYEEIFYCIEKYSSQTDRIKNPTSYMLTLLYNAKEQFHLDITNQVQHDMYGYTPPVDKGY